MILQVTEVQYIFELLFELYIVESYSYYLKHEHELVLYQM